MADTPERTYLKVVGGGFHSGGEPPDNAGMETRVAKLETLAEKTAERLGSIEQDVAVIKSNYATKADIFELKSLIQGSESSMVKWMVGTAIVLGATAITVMTFVLNNATPKASQPAPPVVVQVPPPAPRPSGP